MSLIDLTLIAVRHRKWIAWSTVSITTLALLYALLAPLEFTSSATVIRESQQEAPSLSGGLQALQGLGISLGSLSEGLSPEAYPSVLHGRSVRLAVVRDTFYFPDVGKQMTYVDHNAREAGFLGTIKRYTIELPSLVMQAIEGRPSQQARPGQEYATEAEEKAIEAIEAQLSSSVDQETGLMTIRVTASDPVLASDLASSFVSHLTRRIRGIRTKKARENLSFIRSRYEEAQSELRVWEQRLAQFADRNRNVNTSELRVERDRLERQVRFKANLFSELQNQLTTAELDLKRSSPVVTIVEPPTPPPKRSAPARTLTVLVGLVLGFTLGVGLSIGHVFFQARTGEDDWAKIEEIRQTLLRSHRS